MSAPETNARPDLFDRAPYVLALAAGVCLLVMLVIVFVAVIFRYVFGTPILGVNEIVQLASVGVVMLALPYCTSQGAHVGVDVLDNAIGATGRFIGDIQSRILSGFVLAVLVQRAFYKALDAYEYNDATNMLGIPVWPFYAFIAAGMALCVVILAVELFRLVTRKAIK